VIETAAVGTDGSGTATQAVETALDLAERFGARISTVTHTVNCSAFVVTTT